MTTFIRYQLPFLLLYQIEAEDSQAEEGGGKSAIEFWLSSTDDRPAYWIRYGGKEGQTRAPSDKNANQDSGDSCEGPD